MADPPPFLQRLNQMLGAENAAAFEKTALCTTLQQQMPPITTATQVTLKKLAFHLIQIMLDAGVLDSMIPSSATTLDEVHAVRVLLPKLCHALLLAANLLQHADSPFTRISSTSEQRTWAQVKYVWVDGDGLYELESGMSNPSNFQFGGQRGVFWLQQRYYEPAGAVEAILPTYASFLQLWGSSFLKTTKEKGHLDDTTKMSPEFIHNIPYWKGLKDMTLHAVCFYLCLEQCFKQGCLLERIQKDGRTGMPIKFRIKELDQTTVSYLLKRCIPEFFWTKDSQFTWCTRLCLQCQRPDGSLLQPWLVHDGLCKLAPGDMFINHRYVPTSPSKTPLALSHEIDALSSK